MAFTAWDYAKSLTGTGTKLETLLAGSGGWVKGQPLKADGSGGWIAATGASSDVIMFVSNETVVSGSYGTAVPCTPDNVFRVTKGTGTPVVGTKYGLTATDMTITTNVTATQLAVKPIGIDEANANIYYCVCLGWLA